MAYSPFQHILSELESNSVKAFLNHIAAPEIINHEQRLTAIQKPTTFIRFLQSLNLSHCFLHVTLRSYLEKTTS